MTFTATPQPANVPPRVRLDIGTGDPAASFTDLSVTRDGRVIREQPFVGGATTLAYDYEAPFNTPTTYEVSGNYIPGGTPVWTSTWASLTGWAGVNWSVSAGKAVSSVNTANIVRTTGGTIQKLTVATPTAVKIELLDASDVVVANIQTVTGFGYTRIWGGTTTATAAGLGSYNAQVAGGQFTVTSTTSAWSLTVPCAGTPTKVRIVAVSPAPTSSVGTVSATLTQAPTPFAATATTTLAVDGTWLIHPAAPALSRQIDPGIGVDATGLTYVEASTSETRESQAVRTIHTPVGRAKPVVVTHGARAADDWVLSLTAPTFEERDNLRATVDDQTPLLLRGPNDESWDMPDGWYSVGDVTLTRANDPAISQRSVVTLPLTPVDEPIVRQGALWTYGTGLIYSATYATSRTAFPTYLDRLAGPSA